MIFHDSEKKSVNFNWKVFRIKKNIFKKIPYLKKNAACSTNFDSTTNLKVLLELCSKLRKIWVSVKNSKWKFRPKTHFFSNPFARFYFGVPFIINLKHYTLKVAIQFPPLIHLMFWYQNFSDIWYFVLVPVILFSDKILFFPISQMYI